MNIHESTSRQSFPFSLLFMFVEFFHGKQFSLVPFLTWGLGSKICKYVVTRWVKIFFFVAEQFYFIVTATFFISNELPFLRISQNLHFHKISNFNFTKTKLSFIQILYFLQIQFLVLKQGNTTSRKTRWIIRKGASGLAFAD